VIWLVYRGRGETRATACRAGIRVTPFGETRCDRPMQISYCMAQFSQMGSAKLKPAAGLTRFLFFEKYGVEMPLAVNICRASTNI